MTPADQLAQLQERLTRAVASGAFAEAGRALESYSAGTERALRELPPAQRRELASRVLEFYGRALSLARTGRAQACARLCELSPPSPYRSTPAKSRRHWRLDA